MDNVKYAEKLNELVAQVNDQGEYLRHIDSLFAELSAGGYSAWRARAAFLSYMRKRPMNRLRVVRPMDIPPVIPGTYAFEDDE